MDSNAKIFLVEQKCKELLAFTSLGAVRFMVDSSSCSSKNLTNAKVIINNDTVFLQLDPALK